MCGGMPHTGEPKFSSHMDKSRALSLVSTSNVND